jgi:hypothetical protein
VVLPLPKAKPISANISLSQGWESSSSRSPPLPSPSSFLGSDGLSLSHPPHSSTTLMLAPSSSQQISLPCRLGRRKSWRPGVHLCLLENEPSIGLGHSLLHPSRYHCRHHGQFRPPFFPSSSPSLLPVSAVEPSSSYRSSRSDASSDSSNILKATMATSPRTRSSSTASMPFPSRSPWVSLLPLTSVVLFSPAAETPTTPLPGLFCFVWAPRFLPLDGGPTAGLPTVATSGSTSKDAYIMNERK